MKTLHWAKERRVRRDLFGRFLVLVFPSFLARWPNAGAEIVGLLVAFGAL
jgi:hypothetical protein